MGCNATTSVCDSCFNWGSGSVGARLLANNNCQTALPAAVKTADTKYYSGLMTSTTTKGLEDSAVCTQDYKNFVENGSTVTCSKTAITLDSVTVSKVKDCQT